MTRQLDWWTRAVASVIGLTNPARASLFIQQRKRFLSYKAARREGANSAWRGDRRSQDETLRREWADITARARDLVHSSAQVSGALNRICDNVVFTGIKPQAQPRRGRDNAVRQDLADRIEAEYRRWAESDEIMMVELQRLVLRHQWQDGEMLVHWFYDPDLAARGVVPLGIEMLEADHLDTSKHGKLPNGNTAIRGIEFNKRGRPVAYHLFREHPGHIGGLSFGQSERIPASRIIHVFRRDRVSQTRGVSWLAQVIMEMRDFDEYQDSERIAARLTSAFGFFVETPFPELGSGLLGGQPRVPSTQGAESPVELPDFVDPGRIQTLPPGTKITATGFDRPGASYEPFTRNVLRGASTGVGMSYESFSNDYTGASFSSARSATLEERRGYRVQQDFLNRRFNNPVWKQFCLFLAAFKGGSFPSEVPVRWQNPGWSWVDPVKDAKAQETLLSLGATSRTRIAAEQGQDFSEIVREQARENELMRANGLTEDADAQAETE